MRGTNIALSVKFFISFYLSLTLNTLWCTEKMSEFNVEHNIWIPVKCMACHSSKRREGWTGPQFDLAPKWFFRYFVVHGKRKTLLLRYSKEFLSSRKMEEGFTLARLPRWIWPENFVKGNFKIRFSSRHKICPPKCGLFSRSKEV